MPNILTIFLICSTLFTGFFWIFIRIQLMTNYFLNKKKIKTL